MSVTLHKGDCREVLATDAIADESVQVIVTSPPFWGLRSYLAADHPAKGSELGAEKLHDCLGWARGEGEGCGHCYVCHLREVARGLWRVLRKDGVMFLNLGDSYANDGKWGGRTGGKHVSALHGESGVGRRKERGESGLKPKDLVGIPWRVALALQADGWTLRSEIIWHKPAPMPESVTDRCTKAHEQVFMFSKAARYYCDMEAVKEPASQPNGDAHLTGQQKRGMLQSLESSTLGTNQGPGTRNLRDVWTLSPSPFPGAHFATFPPELPARCIAMGTSAKGCCPTCGKPWGRVVEKGESMWEQRKGNGAPLRAGDVEGGRSLGSAEPSFSGAKLAAWKAAHPDKAAGWRPGCTCDAGEPVPCVVLDPFAGSGTTLFAAVGAGRDAIGIDLSDEYHALIRQRLGLFALDKSSGA